MIKVAVIASTGGSVMNAALGEQYMRSRIATVISDRDCGAIDLAKKRGIDTRQFVTRDARVFSDELAAFFRERPHQLIVSFYTKLFHGSLLEDLRGRFVNFHPSILPACPGMDGFGDTIKSGALFVGATVHFVDQGVDTGFPIIQSSIPFNPESSIAEIRHAVFLSQCKMLIQVVRWFEEGRVQYHTSTRPRLARGSYLCSEFSPNLDFDLALRFAPS